VPCRPGAVTITKNVSGPAAGQRGGRNWFGGLGDGTTTSLYTPPATDVLTGAEAIAAGALHTCALMSTGGVRCWGWNEYGQLGDGTRTDRLAPPPTDVLTVIGSS
jgi:alpha-tubulin suppressor-like RCC1 family protein